MFSLIKHLSNCAGFAHWASSGHRSGSKRDHKSEITNPQGVFPYPGRETLCDQLFRRRSVAASVSDSGRAVLAVCVQRRRCENQSEPDLRSPAAQEGPAAAKPAGQCRAEVSKSHLLMLRSAFIPSAGSDLRSLMSVEVKILESWCFIS